MQTLHLFQHTCAKHVSAAHSLLSPSEYTIVGLGNKPAEAHSYCTQIHLVYLRNPFPTSFVQHPLALAQRDLGSNSSAFIGMHCGKDHWESVFWRSLGKGSL